MATETKYPLSIIIRAVNKATAEFRKLTKDAKKFGEDVGKVGKGITAALTLPMAALSAGSIKAFADFEKGMANVSTLIDTSTENLGAMGKEVQAIGQRVPVALGDLSSALYDVRSAGVAAGDQFAVLENAAKLGVAGLGTTKEASDLVTSALNAFQLKGEEANRVYDTIFKTVKSGKTTLSGLAQGFGGVAGTVAASGTKFDEYLASVAALTTTGLPAAEAHTQLKAVIAGLTRDTTQTAAVFKALGSKNLPDLIAKSGGLVPALERVSKKLKGNQARMLELVGSTEALNAITGLTGAQNGVFTNTLDDMRTGTEALTAAFSKQNKTMHAQAQRTKNAISVAGNAIGELLAPAVEAFAVAVQRLAGWIASLDEDTRKWVVGIGIAVALLGPAIILAGKLATGIVAIKAGIVILGPLVAALALKIKLLGLALFTTPIGWIILGITALIVAGYLLIRNWDKVKLFLESMWEVVTEAFADFLEWLENVFFNFTPLGLIIKHWEPIKEFFASLWDGVTAVFDEAWARIKAIVDKITGAVDSVIGAARKVTGAVSGVGRRISSFFGGGDDEELPTPVGLALQGRAAEIVSRANGPQAVSSSTAVKVEFANAPRGMRVQQDAGGGAAVDLAVGYQLAIP